VCVCVCVSILLNYFHPKFNRQDCRKSYVLSSLSIRFVPPFSCSLPQLLRKALRRAKQIVIAVLQSVRSETWRFWRFSLAPRYSTPTLDSPLVRCVSVMVCVRVWVCVPSSRFVSHIASRMRMVPAPIRCGVFRHIDDRSFVVEQNHLVRERRIGGPGQRQRFR